MAEGKLVLQGCRLKQLVGSRKAAPGLDAWAALETALGLPQSELLPIEAWQVATRQPGERLSSQAEGAGHKAASSMLFKHALAPFISNTALAVRRAVIG